MYSAFDHWAYWSQMLTVISMFLPYTQWVFGPLSPVSRLTETDAESRTNVTILDPPRVLNPKPRFAPFPMPNPPHPRAYCLVSPVSRMVKYSCVEIWPCAVRIHLSTAGRKWLVTLGSTAVPRHTPLEKVCTPSSTLDPCAICSGWVYF